MKSVKDCMIIFISAYFTLKTVGSIAVMPLINTNKEKDSLSEVSKKHYNKVKNNRRIKGTVSMLLSFVIGIIAYFRYGKQLPKDTVFYSLISLVIFMSMTLLYDAMWQDKFIFEEKNISELNVDGINENEGSDIVAYSKIYKKHRLAKNIIEVSSIGLAVGLTYLYNTLNKSFIV
jgi:hypothetical protein